MTEKRGNPNPSPETRFGAGNRANPIGKTSEQRKAEIEAAELAVRSQRAMLAALTDYVEADPAAALESIKADPLKLIKDAMDRAHGKAEETVNNKHEVADGAAKLGAFLANISERSGTDSGSTSE